MGMVHGIRVTYFRDGKTVSSKLSFEHGLKQGPSVKYYKNGQVFEHSSYENGERHGPHRKYYKSGELLAEYNYKKGQALPGLKEYELDGTLVNAYPEVEFREIDHLASRSRIDLELNCTRTRGKMKYFVLTQEDDRANRIYLITENGRATMQYYIQPGETLDRKVDILAEIPTDLGNTLVLELSYQLSVKNVY
jgi:antitoxin component YwqK of YwqJK toxin-antitoxin module